MYTHASQVNQYEYISNITYDEISNLSWFTQLFHWFKGCSTGYFKDFLFLFCLVCSEPDWLPYFGLVCSEPDWRLTILFCFCHTESQCTYTSSNKALHLFPVPPTKWNTGELILSAGAPCNYSVRVSAACRCPVWSLNVTLFNPIYASLHW